VSLVRPI